MLDVTLILRTTLFTMILIMFLVLTFNHVPLALYVHPLTMAMIMFSISQLIDHDYVQNYGSCECYMQHYNALNDNYYY